LSPNEQQQYIHDFGSILNFIEYAFGISEISPNYHYADHFAPDGPVVCTSCSHPYSLSDFFNFSGSPSTFASFIANYPTQCFLTPNINGCFGPSFTPADPDDDAVDQ
jgi:hypothetical protein